MKQIGIIAVSFLGLVALVLALAMTGFNRVRMQAADGNRNVLVEAARDNQPIGQKHDNIMGGDARQPPQLPR
jgi:hypothetical protein